MTLTVAILQLFEGRHQAAFRSAQEGLRTAGAPDARLLLVMAAIALEHKNFGRARELVDLTEKLGGAEGWRHVLAGRLALQENDTVQARAEARAAMDCDLIHPAIAGQLGVLLSRTGLHAEALPYFQTAAAADPGDMQTVYNLAIACQFAGDLDAARGHFRALVERDGSDARSWLALVQLDRQEDAGVLPLLERGFAKAADPAARRGFGHAIAKVLEDLGRWDESFAWLERAKGSPDAPSTHDPVQAERLFAAARDSASISLGAEPAGDLAPVFIVGLPRSGTTLVERIISAHPQVQSAGELSDFALLLKQRVGTPGPLVLDPATLAAGATVPLEGIGSQYIARVRTIVGAADRFIDKMPFNFFYVPLILKVLPGARVICLRRSPFDAVFSNFRQLFANGFTYYSYADRFEDTAAFVAGFEQLADHFGEVLPPGRYMQQRYEDIVADIEGAARALIAFLGLEWDQRCLGFHENAAPVATASSVQVRRPIYATSVERWRRYGRASERLVAILARYGIAPH